MATSIFNMEEINDQTCLAAVVWLDEDHELDRVFLIDSLGGTTTNAFYKLVERAEKAHSITAIAKRAHSASAILFLAFPKRKVDVDGDILFKPQFISMSLKQASHIKPDDLSRYAIEYQRYSVLLARLLRQNSHVSEEHISLLLDAEAMIHFDPHNAVLAGLAQGLYDPGELTYSLPSKASAPFVVPLGKVGLDSEVIDS